MKNILIKTLITIAAIVLLAQILSRIPSQEKEKIMTEIPKEFQLDIPFTSQAPFGNWSPPYDHACEEASALMAYYYLEEKNPSPQEVANDIKKLVEFEITSSGVYKDTSAQETVEFINNYFGYKAKVIKNPSIEDIKSELIKGNPVIAPTDGRALNNPNFTPPGPVYHMLVIKGYNESVFITNDPGTRNGKNYKYAYTVLMDSLSDWKNGLTYEPVIISVEK